jgi:hypothetical protein
VHSSQDSDTAYQLCRHEALPSLLNDVLIRSCQKSWVLFVLELGRRLCAIGSRVMSVAVHPGVANTNLFRAGECSALDSAMRAAASHLIGALLNSDDAGALPTLYATTSPDVTDGGYYGPTGWMEMRGGHVGNAAIASQAKDLESARRLWKVCETMTGVRFP